MEDEKRCYSLNQAAYLIYLGYTYKIKFDEESAKFYIVFPESREIKKDIYEYKSTDVKVSLKGFTGAYKQLRHEINAIRDSKEFRIKHAMCKMRALLRESSKDRFLTVEEQEAYIEDCKHLSQDEMDKKYAKEFIRLRNERLEEEYFDGERVD